MTLLYVNAKANTASCSSRGTTPKSQELFNRSATPLGGLPDPGAFVLWWESWRFCPERSQKLRNLVAVDQKAIIDVGLLASF